MKKIANIIKKVTNAHKISITFRLPFINVTLAPSYIPQSQI